MDVTSDLAVSKEAGDLLLPDSCTLFHANPSLAP